MTMYNILIALAIFLGLVFGIYVPLPILFFVTIISVVAGFALEANRAMRSAVTPLLVFLVVWNAFMWATYGILALTV